MEAGEKDDYEDDDNGERTDTITSRIPGKHLPAGRRRQAARDEQDDGPPRRRRPLGNTGTVSSSPPRPATAWYTSSSSSLTSTLCSGFPIQSRKKKPTSPPLPPAPSASGRLVASLGRFRVPSFRPPTTLWASCRRQDPPGLSQRAQCGAR